jgi:ABC-type Zn uptake system ZnuABC Zn-binding protein ZnuA
MTNTSFALHCHHSIVIRLLLCCLIVLILLPSCQQGVQERPPLKVVATLAPLADWARHVGQERVVVTQIVPTGVDPRKYILTPENRHALVEADVVLSNGLGLEPWLLDVLQERAPTSFINFELAQYIGPLTQSHRAFVHSPPVSDKKGKLEREGRTVEWVDMPARAFSPWLWLDPGPRMSRRGVLLIADTFARAEPENLLYFRGNAERYNGELENLDHWIKRQVRQWPRVKIKRKHVLLVYAADRSWYYFAQRYGITLRTPSKFDRQLTTLSSTPFFMSSFLTPETKLRMQQFAIPNGELHPLSHDDYIQLLRNNVQIMTQAMQRDVAGTVN